MPTLTPPPHLTSTTPCPLTHRPSRTVPRRRAFRGAVLLTGLALVAASASTVRAGWIEDALLAQDLCGMGSTKLDRLGEAVRQTGLGRPPEVWTQADLHALPAAIDACANLSTRPQAMRIDVSGLAEGFARTVHQAWAARDLRLATEAARKRQAEDTARRALEAARAAQVQAEARQQTTESERERVVEEAHAATARAKAEAAEARARRAIEEGRREAAVAQAEARRAAQEADVARLAADAAVAGASPRPVPPPPTASTPPLPPASTASPPSPSVTAGPAQPVFPVSAAVLRQRFDAQMHKDGGHALARCVPAADGLRCTFDEAAFQRSVAEFRRQGLVEGVFDLKLGVMLAERDGHATRVTLEGERGDPMNLFAFVGVLGSLITALEPTIPQADLDALLTARLGLMRGDADATIGRARTEARAAYTITCNQTPSAQSSAIRCVMEPRA